VAGIGESPTGPLDLLGAESCSLSVRSTLSCGGGSCQRENVRPMVRISGTPSPAHAAMAVSSRTVADLRSGAA
jgi:hypothetical protein